MFYVNKKEARLILLQRIELCSDFLKKIRKFFGRHFFSNFITKFFLNNKTIGKSYYNRMHEEFKTFEKYIDHNDKMLQFLGGNINKDKISGFIYIGHKIEEPLERKRPNPFDVVSFL